MANEGAVELLREQPRIFWGRAIKVLIDRGWTPPPPDERIVDELLVAMELVESVVPPPALHVPPPAPDVPQPDDVDLSLLTPTEARVAVLVTTGLSNKEVAAELVVGIQTVKFHLSNIYRKLGIRSRSQLTWFVMQQREPG